jgi:hypothetical protein
MSKENRDAVVHNNELAAMKDSRKRDMPVFAMREIPSLWVVAASEHQAKLAMVDRVWPMTKLTKKERDERYTDLLEAAFDHPPMQSEAEQAATA